MKRMGQMICAGAAALVAMPALAAMVDDPPTERREERIIIIDRGGPDDAERRAERRERVRPIPPTPPGDSADARQERRERTRVIRPGRAMAMRNCREGESVADIDERTGDERTRILLCGGSDDPARFARSLTETRERIAANSHLSEEHKARILAALDREIERRR